MKKSIIEKALKIRAFENTLLRLFNNGNLGGTVHTCIGQEYTPIILSKYYSDGDYILSNHRGHGHYLAFNDYNYDPILKEILGRNDGCSKGIGGSQHLSSKYFLSNGIQGGMTPIGCGISYGLKFNSRNNICFVFIGDGTLGQGVVYESLNIAGLYNLPIIFICEDNGIAQSTPKNNSFSGSMKNRALGFGIEYHKISDILESENIIEETITKARNNIPQFLHIKSTRLYSHSKGDDNRDDDFIDDLNNSDPLNLELKNSQSLKKQYLDLIEHTYQNALKLSNQKEFFSLISNTSHKNKYEEYSFSNLDVRYNQQINNSLKKNLKKYVNLHVIGEDIRDTTLNPCNNKVYGGAFKTTLNLSKNFNLRVLNFPISEQLIVGFSTGLSLINDWIICEIMFADFTTLIVDQVLQHLSKFKIMLGGNHEPKVIIRTPIGGYRGYGPTHSQCLENLFIGIPNFNVYAMNRFIDPDYYYKTIFSNNTPTLLLENKIMYTETSSTSNIFKIKIINDDKFPKVHLTIEDLEKNSLVICYGQISKLAEDASIKIAIEDEERLDILIFSDLNEFEFSNEIINLLNSYNKILIVSESSTNASWSSTLGFNIKTKTKVNNVDLVGNDWIVPAGPLEKKVLPNANNIIKWSQKNI